ncbi:MAG: hypothetical protein AB8G16_05520 [Gammaproteobacteria bacterium]
MRIPTLIILGSLLSTHGALAQLNEWQAIHPHDPQMPLGGPLLTPSYDSNGIARAISTFGYPYHRDEATAPWVRDEVTVEGSSVYVAILATSAADESYQYATLRSGGIAVKRGADRVWENSVDTFDFWISLEAAPSSELVAYAYGPIGGLRGTDDGGFSWTTFDNVNVFIRDIAIDPFDPSTLFLAAGSDILRSTDGGTTFEPIQPINIPATPFFTHIEINPTNANILVAIAGRDAYRTVDGGDTWQRLAQQPWRPSFEVDRVAFDPVAPDTMYLVSTDEGSNVYRSSDGGVSWQTIADDLIDENIFAMAVSNSGEQLLGTFTGSYTALPGGNFVSSNLGWSDLPFEMLAFAPNDSRKLYAPTRFSGLAARSADLSWNLRNTDPQENSMEGIWASPEQPGKLLLAAGSSIYSSSDDGASWNLLYTTSSDRRAKTVVASADGNLIFASFFFRGLVRSADGGQTWEENFDLTNFGERDQSPILISPEANGVVYAASFSEGILRSTDSGVNWTPIPTPFEDQGTEFLRADPFNDKGLYVMVNARDVWYSPDAGVTWKNLRGPSLPNGLMAHLAVDPFIEGRVYVTFDVSRSIYVLDPQANDWKTIAVPRDLLCRGSRSCRVFPDPQVRGRLLATTTGELFSMQLDSDDDSVGDNVDNCVFASNPEQRDTDGDGFGNWCDADIAPAVNDCIVNVQDLGALRQTFGSEPGDANWNSDADFNGDDQINVIDLGLLRQQFFRPPGDAAGASCE